MQRTIKILRPSYYNRFSCIGSACEDNCCKGWDIVIDKNTYLRYKQVKDSAFAEALPDRVKRIRGPKATSMNYARFVLDEKGVCKFQTEDLLCDIQRTLGHKYLCHTCQIYPRLVSMVFENVLEASLSMSCPEVVRVALLNPEPMTFELSEVNADPGDVLLKHPPRRPDPKGKSAIYVEHAWVMREAAIDILQCRNMSIANRIFTVGMMMDKVTALGKEENTALIPAAVSNYAGAAREGKFAGSLESFSDNEDVRTDMNAILINTIFQRTISGGDSNQPFREFMAGFINATGLTVFNVNNLESYTAMNTYAESNTAKHWPSFLEERDYILENFFVNYVFTSMFPFYFQEDLNPYQHFIVLAEQYALLRMLLCGIAGEEGSITDELLTRVINSISVLSQHSQQAMHISQIYSNSNCDDLGHISFLLRA